MLCGPLNSTYSKYRCARNRQFVHMCYILRRLPHAIERKAIVVRRTNKSHRPRCDQAAAVLLLRQLQNAKDGVIDAVAVEKIQHRAAVIFMGVVQVQALVGADAADTRVRGNPIILRQLHPWLAPSPSLRGTIAMLMRKGIIGGYFLSFAPDFFLSFFKTEHRSYALLAHLLNSVESV
jgi:hypothetical protein